MKYENNDAFFNDLRENMIVERQRLLQQGKRTVTSRDYANVIIQTADIVKDKSEHLIMNYDEKIMKRDYLFIRDCINQMQENTSEPLAEKTIREVLTTLDSAGNVPNANKPPENIRKFKNGVFDLKEKKMIEDNNWTHYNEVPVNILPLNDIDPKNLAIVKKIFSDWSDGNEEKERQIKEIAFVTMQGYGREKLIILKGPGGNGKSIFLEICDHLAGKGGVIYANLNEIGDDNKFNNIGAETNLIVGDDLATNAKLSGEKLSRFKQLISGSKLQLNVKYQNDRVIYNKAVFVQATNSDADFYENNQSIHRRLHLINWTKRQFLPSENFKITFEENDETVESTYDLKNILKDKDESFFEAFVSYVIHTTPYPEKDFFETKESKNAVLDMVGESDQVSRFIDYIVESGITSYPRIPVTLIYHKYVEFLKDVNMSSKPLSQKTFNKRFYELMEDYGYFYEDKLTRLNYYDFPELNKYLYCDYTDFVIIENTFFKKSMNYLKFEKNDRSRYLINKNLMIDKSSIKAFKTFIKSKKCDLSKLDLNTLSFIGFQTAFYQLLIVENNTYIAGSIKELESDFINVLFFNESEMFNFLKKYFKN